MGRPGILRRDWMDMYVVENEEHSLQRTAVLLGSMEMLKSILEL